MVLILGSAILLKAGDLAGRESSAVTKEAQHTNGDLAPVPPDQAPPELNEANGEIDLLAKRYKEAHQKLRLAGMMGRAKAQYYLGNMYRSGLGVPKSESEAVRWYAKAVRRGYLPAFSALANLFRFAEGIEKNPSEAFKLSRMAAEQGDAEGQFELGQCYQFGEGVAKSEEAAEKWYRRAAEQGNLSGQEVLAYLYSAREFRLFGEAMEAAATAAEAMPEVGMQRDPWVKGAIKSKKETTLMKQFDLSPQIRELRIEELKWKILAAKQGYEEFAETVANATRTLTNTNDSSKTQNWQDFSDNLPGVKERVAEAFRRAAAFVPRRERSSDWVAATEWSDGSNGPMCSGTGFLISEDGYLVTNFHVVEDAMRITVQYGRNSYSATLAKADPVNDLALLKVTGKFNAIPVAPSRTAKLGDSVFTVGFPNPELQGVAPKLTDGKISSLSGVRDDARHFQISVAVQPGNSGGALVNSAGNVVGVVSARLSDKAALETSGAIPQNVNYAIKSSYVLPLLESLPEVAGKLRAPWPARERKFEEVVKEAEDASALILAY